MMRFCAELDPRKCLQTQENVGIRTHTWIHARTHTHSHSGYAGIAVQPHTRAYTGTSSLLSKVLPGYHVVGMHTRTHISLTHTHSLEQGVVCDQQAPGRCVVGLFHTHPLTHSHRRTHARTRPSHTRTLT